MQRVALILMLFILLMNGRHGSDMPPATFDSLVVQARAIPLEKAGDAAAFGPLTLTGAWQLTSPHKAFGGISSLLVDDDGAMIGLSDTGELFGFRVSGAEGKGFIEPLPRIAAEQHWPGWRWDSESMQRDPVSGRIWVGFEGLQRICRYAPDFRALEGCVEPPEMADWPVTGSIESLVRFGDGRFLAIAEMAIGPAGAHDVLLWQGDPVDPATPPPVHLGYRPPTGYRPTDALWLGGDRLLVLNRRLTLADGFTARLSLVTLPPLAEGAILTGKPIATFAPPGLADNFEALALSRQNGQPVLWVASDDNHLFLQRSLLMRFALPAGWVSDAPAP
ncbi:hypothetical protein SLG_33910 [Sphingobium sp. SYK-6]|uniref:esterase-like activity of phytase family protein n=1 Tax=Sphingobium sp. (strain NBRC 103272 / SYK-6) TaxID=627192 RepID=UPI000227796E|nr:esterase-like activity of phytase family protein [Sphingobium sp. SYK-6]BAK68066.1 hypothetical protein SLG_33910 [Sphingobium sp. SYK-6]